ncbi:MAG: dethiobiotin synthase [Gammaproteobacteria bacterium]
MQNRLFVVGTDTNIGKTYTTCGLLKLAKKNHLSTLGLKPLATGSSVINGNFCNEDALLLQNNSTIHLPYSLINPLNFSQPISPNIASKYEQQSINLDTMVNNTLNAFCNPADIIFVESVGGWFTPINEKQTMADFACRLNLPIILVVGLRLGCLNHALLTISAIQNTKLRIAGWVANCIDRDMLAINDNISTLQSWINQPLIGIIPFKQPPEEHLSLDFLRRTYD